MSVFTKRVTTDLIAKYLRVHGLLRALSALNYRMPLGHLSYDPRDGEVALRYGLPIADDELAYENFQRILVVFQSILAKHVPGLRAIVAGEKTAREVLG